MHQQLDGAVAQRAVHSGLCTLQQQVRHSRLAVWPRPLRRLRRVEQQRLQGRRSSEMREKLR